jgi:hypothetical protein
MPLMYQKSNGVCWYASARMLYTWARATKRGSMTNPADDTGYFQRYMNNGDVAASQNWHIAQQFNMQKHIDIPMNYDSINSFLAKHGPIWTGLKKNWDNFNHGHVVVICGVADTGVFIHDPEPVKQGSTRWLTWGEINKAVNGMSGADPQFLTAV